MLSIQELSPYKLVTEFTNKYNGSVQKDAIGNKLKKTSLSFLHHWSLFLILAITDEGRTLLLDFATDAHPDLHLPKNIFHYITGPVNLILKAIGNTLNNQFPKNTHIQKHELNRSYNMNSLLYS